MYVGGGGGDRHMCVGGWGGIGTCVCWGVVWDKYMCVLGGGWDKYTCVCWGVVWDKYMCVCWGVGWDKYMCVCVHVCKSVRAVGACATIKLA